MLSRQSGTEFASITIGDKHYIIKGDKKSTPISEEVFKAMKKNKGTLNCHAHPYIGDIRPSVEDLEFAEIMNWQNEFYIVSPNGEFATYNKYGIVDIGIVLVEITKAEKEKIKRVFGGGKND